MSSTSLSWENMLPISINTSEVVIADDLGMHAGGGMVEWGVEDVTLAQGGVGEILLGVLSEFVDALVLLLLCHQFKYCITFAAIHLNSIIRAS